MPRTLLISICWTILSINSLFADSDSLLVEAESFQDHGSWKLDTQFIDIMGSPYLLAHGLGTPCQNAIETLQFPSTGIYHVWVRTKDWVSTWDAKGQPGRFQVKINGNPLKETFGTKGKEWFWHYGGEVALPETQAKIELKDLTGFEGRCDAIYFSKNKNDVPPSSNNILNQWRKEKLGLPDQPVLKDKYDLVVIGGGYSGIGSAISAARMGCSCAHSKSTGARWQWQQ